MGSFVGTPAASAPAAGRAAALRSALGRGGTTWMIVGSLLAGVGAYLFQIVGARSVGEVDYAPISVLWTVQYLLTSILMTALENWVVRTTTSGDGSVHALRAAAPRLLAAVGSVAVLTFGAAYAARDLLLPGHTGLVVVVPLLVVAYSAFVIVRGVLAARERYKAYGGVTAIESMARLGGAAAVAVTIPSAALLALCLPLGAVSAAVWGLVTRLRSATSEGDASNRAGVIAFDQTEIPAVGPGPGRFLAVTSSANAAAQILLAAGPLVLGPLGASPRDVSVLFVTLTAARVPLVIVQGGLLSRLLPTLTRMARGGAATALRMAGARLAIASAAAAVVAGLAGWVIGPPLVALLFGDGFRPGAATTATVAAGVVAATGAIIVNQVLIAMHRETLILLPWFIALAVAAVGILVTGALAPVDRVLIAFVLGEATALLLLGLSVLITRPHGLVPPVKPTTWRQT